MNRLSGLGRLLLRAAQSSSKFVPGCSALLEASQTSLAQPAQHAAWTAIRALQSRSFHSSSLLLAGDGHGVSQPGGSSLSEIVVEPPRKYRDLSDKELWHESWMYEDKFGTPEDPILVPSTEPERIIGVVDPEDDCTIIWAMLKESDPPRQLYENGEYFALIRVDFIRRVGDVLEELEAAPDKQLSK